VRCGEGVEGRDAEGLEIAHIPGGYGEAVNARGGGDEGILKQIGGTANHNASGLATDFAIGRQDHHA
jgi:hypothetical protein